jgi:hypothetical protein
LLVQPDRRPEVAARAFDDACGLGFAVGCDNLAKLNAGLPEEPRRAPPTDSDYRILLRGRKGGPVELPALELHQRACTQGFADGCRQACAEGDASLCAPAEP